jgi:hypothetical protein
MRGERARLVRGLGRGLVYIESSPACGLCLEGAVVAFHVHLEVGHLVHQPL